MGWFKDFFFGDLEDSPEEKKVEKSENKVEVRRKKSNKQINKQQAVKKKIAFNQQTNSNPEIQPIIRRNQRNRSSISAKMVYQYPKGEFRFPLIPDNNIEEKTPKEVHAKEMHQTRKALHRNEPSTESEIETIKKPFVAADVPSPVFAFKKRPSKYDFTANDHEEKALHEDDAEKMQQNLVKEEVETESIITIETPSFDQSDSGAIQANATLENEKQPTNIITTPPSSETNINETKTESIEIEENKSEPVITTVSTAEKKPVNQMKQRNQSASVKTSANKHPKTHIPFNVMMVKRDKKNNEKKQMISKEASNAKHEVVTSEAMPSYYFPSRQLLNPPVFSTKDETWLNNEQALLNETLENFNVQAKVVDRTQGPAVTRFEVQPEKGVKVNKITNLSDDIKLNLAAKDIRIEAPIPGKSTVGIEIPNPQSRPVMLSEIMETTAFQTATSPLTAALGLDISGAPIITDLQKMPHGLIAGATGSGKSVCINSLLVSLLYKATPDQLKLLLIDPKMVELAPYNNIPHLVSPVITDAKAATAALKWAVEEMERRYQLFSHTGVRNMEKYNEYASHPDHTGEKLPYILIIIDELADLMMIAPSNVEEAISRIAQKARACGINMIVATQRPSVDVITGLIKANIPTRISFSVSSQIDSRTILDVGGAEKLLGRGDMLFLANGTNKPVRLQGTFVSDEEIDAVVAHVRNQGEPNYLFEQEELLAKTIDKENVDELFDEACEFVLTQNAASTSLLQRHFRIGYNRAARLMEALEAQQIVSGTNGTKPRDVIITKEQLAKLKEVGQ